MASNPSAVTLKDALRTYQKGLDTERSKTIDVDRSKLWKTALVLYKSTPKEHLYRQLNVMFEGLEDAVDAGALRLEFFGDLLRSINNTLFEGKPDHRVPLYSWENIYLMKMAGIMVSHSILQNGPGMPCLAPYVYEFIIWGDKEHAAAYVTFEDLPETSQTEVLMAFLKGVDDAQTDEDINSLLDDPKYSTIVDRSGWPVGRVLNLKSKGDFITSILVEELVDKRIQLLQNFREGLDHFSLLKLMKESPNLWKPFFLTEGPTPLSADVFMNLVEPPREPDELQAKAYELFLEFIKDHVDCTENVPALNGDVPVLNLLLKFITTNLQVPPTGLERKIAIRFLQLQDSLPDAQSCFNIILLPVKYDNTEEFNKAMLTSLRYASCSFASGF